LTSSLILPIPQDAPYGVTLIWSFVGIFAAQQARHAAVKGFCIAALLMLLPATLSTVLSKRSGSRVPSTVASPSAAAADGSRLETPLVS